MAQADTTYVCDGHQPNWRLSLEETEARFSFANRKTRFDIPHFTAAEGREWPRAYSLVSDFDTAIAIVDLGQCKLGNDMLSHRVQVLTQRGQTPILLTGCCEVAE